MDINLSTKTNNNFTINYWIKQAADFNNQWEDIENKHQALQKKLNISLLEQCKLEFYQQQIKLLTQQKDNCQIMALRLAFHQATTLTESPIIIELDPNESGKVYSLESRDLKNKYRCHIPKQKLVQYLTNKELLFFQII